MTGTRTRTTRVTAIALLVLRTGELKMSHRMSKPIKWPVRQAKTQISLGICPVWSESSLYAEWVAKDQSFIHANRKKDSDQTGHMPRLISVFSGLTGHFVGFVMLRFTWNKQDNPITENRPVQRVRHKSSLYLVSLVLCTWCYFQKTGSPSHNFSGKKNF